MKQTHILITGASGCVGQYTAAWLLKNSQAKLLLWVRNPEKLTAVDPKNPRIKLLVGDLRQSNKFAEELAEISSIGLQRTIQIPTAFNDMTVEENIIVGATFAGKSRILSTKNCISDHVREIICLCKLEEHKNIQAGVLAILQKKLLMVATALAGMPKLLMLDEPLGGLNKDERNQMLEFLYKIKNSGINLMIIEHVMSALLNFVDQLILLNHGKIIFKGTPDQAVNNEEVISVYLGNEAKLLKK